ncbi:MAG TPA: hypothetical protein VHQ70_11280 [Syntrophomonadaceae bacterium]|nr:hypothetical protein [Syntrophomonadaceae bacterium]
MKLVAVENFRLTDRNKAGGDGMFDCDGHHIKAELVYYLQGNQCLSIKLGRHDISVATTELEKYITAHQSEMRNMVADDVERLRKERQAMINTQE